MCKLSLFTAVSMDSYLGDTASRLLFTNPHALKRLKEISQNSALIVGKHTHALHVDQLKGTACTVVTKDAEYTVPTGHNLAYSLVEALTCTAWDSKKLHFKNGPYVIGGESLLGEAVARGAFCEVMFLKDCIREGIHFKTDFLIPHAREVAIMHLAEGGTHSTAYGLGS